MSDEEEQKCDCPPGLPGWMATFADLMSLLMCFFVLLLSFAEMDVLKFKRLAGSMREAFGVQNQVDVNDIPKGTSIVAQEFSPGKPEPTPIQTVMQMTTDADQSTLEIMCQAEVDKAVENQCPEQPDSEMDAQSPSTVVQIQQLVEETEENAMELAQQLENEIRSDMLEIETMGRKIVVRVQEKGSFASGSAELQSEFLPVLDKLTTMLSGMEGRISVEGHTDSIPINTTEFPSNWHLSTARALEVAQGLFYDNALDESRFTVVGYADTRPLVPNDTPENRSRNRRVEVVLVQPNQAVPEQDGAGASSVDENIQIIESQDLEASQPDEGLLDLDPDDIF